MDIFTLHTPTDVIFGKNALSKLKTMDLSVKKALIVTSENTTLNRYNHLDKVIKTLESLDIKYIIFDEIEGVLFSDTLNKGATVARDFSCDFVIGLGSQKTIDAAKLIATLVHQDDFAIKEIFKVGKIQKSLPSALEVIAIPTNFKLEASLNSTVHLYRQVYQDIAILHHKALTPTLTIVDPYFIEEIDIMLTQYESIDTLAKALSIIIHQKHPVHTLYAKEALEYVIDGLLAFSKHPTDQEAKEHLQYAALLLALASDELENSPLVKLQNTFMSLNPTLPQGVLLREFLVPYLKVMNTNQIAQSNIASLNGLFEVDVVGYSLKEQVDIFIQHIDDLLDRVMQKEHHLRKYDIDQAHINDYVHHFKVLYPEFSILNDDELYMFFEDALVK